MQNKKQQNFIGQNTTYLKFKYINDRHISYIIFIYYIQWNPSCEATPFALENWPFKRGGLSTGVEINTFMFRFTLSSGLSRGGGLSSGLPLKRGSNVKQYVGNAVISTIKVTSKYYEYFLEI